MSLSNYASMKPESLHRFLDIKQMVVEICRDEMIDAVDAADRIGTKLAAYAYLARREGELPGTKSDFLAEIRNTRGKTVETQLVNYLIGALPVRNQGLVQTVKNQMVSTVSLLNEVWSPIHAPTFDDVIHKITDEGVEDTDRRGKKKIVKGLQDFHRLWMSHLSAKTVQEQQETNELLRLGAAAKRQQRADALGEELGRKITVEELDEMDAQDAKRTKQEADREQWKQYTDSGEIVTDPETFKPVVATKAGSSELALPVEIEEWAIYIGPKDGSGPLIRLSDDHCLRIRECMLRS